MGMNVSNVTLYSGSQHTRIITGIKKPFVSPFLLTIYSNRDTPQEEQFDMQILAPGAGGSMAGENSRLNWDQSDSLVELDYYGPEKTDINKRINSKQAKEIREVLKKIQDGEIKVKNSWNKDLDLSDNDLQKAVAFFEPRIEIAASLFETNSISREVRVSDIEAKMGENRGIPPVSTT